ncbi:hypothetical protein QBC41DRAFT_266732 [Cercophora samala]|uniref:Ryanodine receptor Ryr domain-containing protein n=1 Tax=Cercophora samala TaxID=330535 RepID=A0AA39ZL90_9PEZI|nr:hypothetical protein QBC41DRAFT_266732 [Cercophora samala]
MTSSQAEKEYKEEFTSFETSVAIIQRTGYKFPSPIPWSDSSSEDAIKFIKQPSARDKRLLLASDRFRILNHPSCHLDRLVKYPDGQSELYQQKAVLDAAREAGWFGELFDAFINNSTSGSAVLDSSSSFNLVAQTPKDDHFSFFSFSLSQRFTDRYRHNADWECILFVRPSTFWDESIEGMLCADPFPRDYVEPLLPDFLVLPVVLLRCQVQQIMKEVTSMKQKLVEQDQDVTDREVDELKNIRNELFALRKKNLFLRRRCEFAMELSQSLVQSFGILERRVSSEDEVVKYSPTLVTRVANQQAILKNVLDDLDTTASMGEDKITHTLTYQFSQRDSTSLKIIAVVTLIFLPGTFVATLFSMELFNWQVGSDEENPKVVSHWIWLYFAVTIALTVVVVLVWKGILLGSTLSFSFRRNAMRWSKHLLPLYPPSFSGKMASSTADMTRIIIAGDAPEQLFLYWSSLASGPTVTSKAPQARRCRVGVQLLAEFLEQGLKGNNTHIQTAVHRPGAVSETNAIDSILELESQEAFDRTPSKLSAPRFKSRRLVNLETNRLWHLPDLPTNATGAWWDMSTVIFKETGNERKLPDENVAEVLALFKNCQPRFLIYHMVGPLCSSKIWDAVRHGPASLKTGERDPQRVMVVVEANDLRAEGIELSHGLSWEKTCEDFVEKLGSVGTLVSLVTCAHLIVLFGCEGVIYHRGWQVAKPVLYFDPLYLEGEFLGKNLGYIPGLTDAFVAGLASRLTLPETGKDVEEGIIYGLQTARRLAAAGLANPAVADGSFLANTYRTMEIMNPLTGDEGKGLLRFAIPSDNIARNSDPGWSILDQVIGDPAEVARQIVRQGSLSSRQVPLARFKQLLLFDRREIEFFRTIHNFLEEYFLAPMRRPLCISLFGPGGSGKAFAAHQVFEAVARDKLTKRFDFDLSQFTSVDDLLAAFHSIRDVSLKGYMPMAYFNAFDCTFEGSALGWLPHLLSVMFSGCFSDRGVSRPLGAAVFFFGSASIKSYDDFRRKASKGVVAGGSFSRAQEFLACLHAFGDMSGPDKMNGREGEDKLYPVRRAVIIRTLLERREPNLVSRGEIDIDDGVLNALLLVPTYRQGIRSIKSIIDISRLNGRHRFERSSLPPPVQLDLHVEYKVFMRYLNGSPLPEQLREPLAKALHQKYLDIRGRMTGRDAPQPGDLKSWDEITEELRESSRAHADSIPSKLREIKCFLAEKQDGRLPVKSFDNDQIDLLGKIEHDRWSAERLQNQWGTGEERDPGRRKTPFLKPWEDLEENWKDVDRQLVASYPDILPKSHEIYALGPRG